MPETIFLIDAYAQIYRGYYAMPPLTNAAGQPTGAVLAFAKFLLALEREHPSPLGAVVFDVGKPAHRLALAPEYKAQRPPMPEALKAQTPLIRNWLDAAGWPVVEREGMEADDLIAGLAANFADHSVYIISGDKDLCQLVDARVQLLVPEKKGGFTRRGPAEVEAKFDVRPDQVVDYLSLIGDASDNIPGVTGVGPKTAAKLIAQFGSIEALLARPHEVANENLRNRLVEAKDILALNRQLIRLETELPDPVMRLPAAITRRSPDWERLLALAAELELNSLVRDLEALRQAPAPGAPPAAPTVPPPPAPARNAHFTPDLF